MNYVKIDVSQYQKLLKKTKPVVLVVIKKINSYPIFPIQRYDEPKITLVKSVFVTRIL